MFSKLNTDISSFTKDHAFSIVHFSPAHYFDHIVCWPAHKMLDMADTPGSMSDVFYVIEDKLYHAPIAISDSIEELRIYADLNSMQIE